MIDPNEQQQPIQATAFFQLLNQWHNAQQRYHRLLAQLLPGHSQRALEHHAQLKRLRYRTKHLYQRLLTCLEQQRSAVVQGKPHHSPMGTYGKEEPIAKQQNQYASMYVIPN